MSECNSGNHPNPNVSYFCSDCGKEMWFDNTIREWKHYSVVKVEPAKHFHTMNCPLDPETHLCPIGWDGKRK